MLEGIIGVCIIVLILRILAFCLDLYLKREKREPRKINAPQPEIRKIEENYFEEVRNIKEEKQKEWGDAYEKSVGLEYENEGYDVEYRGLNYGRKDGGIDLIARKDNEIILIQCKYWKKKEITHNMVKEFYGNCHFYMDKHYIKENVSCVYAIPGYESLSAAAEFIFKENFVKLRYKIIKMNKRFIPKY